MTIFTPSNSPQPWLYGRGSSVSGPPGTFGQFSLSNGQKSVNWLLDVIGPVRGTAGVVTLRPYIGRNGWLPANQDPLGPITFEYAVFSRPIEVDSLSNPTSAIIPANAIDQGEVSTGTWRTTNSSDGQVDGYWVGDGATFSARDGWSSIMVRAQGYNTVQTMGAVAMTAETDTTPPPTSGSSSGSTSGSALPTGGLTISHHLSFVGPGYVPTSTDETSARETTGGTDADIGITPTILSLDLPRAADVPSWND